MKMFPESQSEEVSNVPPTKTFESMNDPERTRTLYALEYRNQLRRGGRPATLDLATISSTLDRFDKEPHFLATAERYANARKIFGEMNEGERRIVVHALELRRQVKQGRRPTMDLGVNAFLLEKLERDPQFLQVAEEFVKLNRSGGV